LLLTGLISFETVMSVYHQGLVLLQTQPKAVIIDLQGVLQGDSSILALLSAWIRYTMTQEKQITFINLPNSLKHLIQLSGLEVVFPVRE
jgi:ABC-type transporter Mla MlaB component